MRRMKRTMSEERFYFRDYIPEAYECPCYVKSTMTSDPVSTDIDKGLKFTNKISLFIDPKCKWHDGRGTWEDLR
jgi:hypothetical protein